MARRIFGPYKHGNRYRLVLRDGDAEVVESFGSKEEAAAERKRIEGTIAEHEGVTVEMVIEKYELHLRAKGVKPGSIKTTVNRLNAFFADHMGRRLNLLTVEACKKMYAELVAKWAADTHRSTLTSTRAMFRWAIEQGYAKKNPAAEVKLIGKTKKGKPQLRIDEARKWLDKALEMAQTSPHAAAAAVTLLMGTRATETAVRKVRDLDDGGRLLWIEDTKSEAGKRTMEVPEVLRPILNRLAHGKKGTDKLFHHVDRQSMFRITREICDLVGVPRVSPHGMRGLYSTLGIQTCAVPHMVAASMGHASFAMTEAHYVNKEVAAQTKQRAALKVLQGGR